MESEKNIERKLKLIIESKNGLCVKLPALHHIGIPDRLCLLPGGVLFFAEIKTTNQKVRKSQIYVHKKLKELGFTVYIIDTSESIHLIKELT